MELARAPMTNPAPLTEGRRHYLDGKPYYYCAKCGLGFWEFMACELPDCELETEDEAKKRAALAQENERKP